MAKQPQPSMADQNAAYARAEQAISEAGKSGAATLALSGDDFKHLATLPPDIANLTALTRLTLRNTQVSDITPLAGLTSLTRLDLSSTQFSDIAPLAGLTALTNLYLLCTQVSDITPLAGLTALTNLSLRNTQVSDITPLAGLTALTRLYLSGTQVSDIAPLAGLTSLTRLDLSSTQFSDIAPLAGLTALTNLHLSRTQVSDIAPLAGLTALTHLDLDGTQVSDIAPLAQLTDLAQLHLSRTPVNDISHLANMELLITLDLSETLVSDPSILSNLIRLNSLDLSNTRVNDISDMLPKGAGLCILTHLNLSNTPVSDLYPLSMLSDFNTEIVIQFAKTATANADPHIAEIANTADENRRSSRLFDYLSHFGDAAQNLRSFETRLTNEIQRFDEFVENTNEQIKTIKSAFSEATALQAPVELWKEKRKEHQEKSDTARKYFYWSLVGTAIAVIILAAILIFCTDVAYAIFTPGWLRYCQTGNL